MLWIIFFVVLPMLVLVWSFKGFNEKIDVKGKSVFISGCDTGFGHLLALKLDKIGMKVYAGCLTDQGAKKLKESSSNLQAFICDITKPEDIASAVKTVSASSPEGLFALVNNAGIASPAEWDWYPEKHLRQVMEVNFFGHVAITKAFLSQLKRTKGRIVNLASVAGFAATPQLGGYACSKFALEAFTDSLRREMRKWGVSVFVIEPGFAATPMVLHSNVTISRIWNDATDEHKREYGQEYGEALLNPPLPPTISPDQVLDAMANKLIYKYPTMRTRVGPLAHFAFITNSFLPTSWADNLMDVIYKGPVPAVLKRQ